MTVQVNMEALMAEQDRIDPRLIMGSIVYSDTGGISDTLRAVAAFLSVADAMRYAWREFDAYGGTVTVVDFDTRKTRVIGSAS